MSKVIFQKSVWLLVTLVALSLIAFATIVPANEMRIIRHIARSPDPYWISSNVERYGWFKPMYVQYFLWVKHWVQGDWGESLIWRQPVRDIVLSSLGRTLVVYTPLFLLFCGLTFVLWIRTGLRNRINRNLLLGVTCLRAVPMYFWALALAVIVMRFFYFNPYLLFYFLREETTWNLPRILDLLPLLVAPTLLLGLVILTEFFVARQRRFEIARDDLEAFKARQFPGKAARKARRHLVLTQFIHALRDFLPRFASELVLFSVLASWPTLGGYLAYSLREGDPRLSCAIFFVITGGVAVGCFLLDVWAAWLERDKFRHLNGAAATI